jgi:ATP-binding cassette subfamily F protein 3
MSGGEKARLVLAMIVWQRPNLLLLDEPTNHLDLATREALSMALNEFEGTVMLVSHDRALLRESATSSGWWPRRLGPSTATWTTTSYLLERSREAQRAASGKPAALPRRQGAPARTGHTAPDRPPPRHSREDRKAAAQARAKLADLTRPLRNEQEQIDKRLEKLGGEKTEVEALLATPGLSGEQFAEHGRRLAHIQAELAMLEERWLALGEEIEALTRQAG